MENFDIISEFKLLAKKLQQDDRIIYLEQAKKMNDMDQELQELIGKFNLCQYNYRTEDAKKDKDEAKLSQLYSEITDLYAQIMENDSMKEYNECKTEVDRLTQHIQAIISAAINGGDPMAVELPAGGCSGNCSGCSGCGN